MKQKKNLTIAQQIRKKKAIGYTLNGASILSILLPYIIIGSVNYEQWFTTEDGWRIGLGGALAMALMGLATWIVTANKEKQEKMTNGWITIIVGWFAIALVFVLLESIMNQIATIMLYGGIGLLGAFGFDLGAKKVKEDAKLLKDAKNDALKDEVKEKIKEEKKEDSNSSLM